MNWRNQQRESILSSLRDEAEAFREEIGWKALGGKWTSQTISPTTHIVENSFSPAVVQDDSVPIARSSAVASDLVVYDQQGNRRNANPFHLVALSGRVKSLETPSPFAHSTSTIFAAPVEHSVDIAVFPAKCNATETTIPGATLIVRWPWEVELVVPSECLIEVIVIDVPFGWALLLDKVYFRKSRPEPRTLVITDSGTERTSVDGRITTPIARPSKPEEMANNESLEERLRWILTPPIHEELSDPRLSLPARPYKYQAEGIQWLRDRTCALLADEMGLGKTMQAIIAARLLWRQDDIKQVMVVCRKSLISNWENEFRRWWPSVAHNILTFNTGRDRRRFLRLATPNATVKIINYESLRAELSWLQSQEFSHDLVIIDEAQQIKNPTSATSRAVKALKANRRWALTGTPIENKLSDLISIFGFVNPALVSKNMTQRAVIEKTRDYRLRRLTQEVLPELPEMQDELVSIILTPEQREVYNRMEAEGVLELNSKGDSITVQHIFALITKLRQICNFEPLSGKSAKMDRLLEDLEDISASERKALLFSQFVKAPFGISTIARSLEENGYDNLEFHGEIPAGPRRDQIINRFREEDEIRLLLLNYSVGGAGLNLQAANYVYLFDRWWNPAVEDQAVKRAHRIGQQHKVFVRRFYCKDTFEERIVDILARKRVLANVINEDRIADNLGLSEEELFLLFKVSARPRRPASKQANANINLNNLDWRGFQDLIAELYERQGYKVRVAGDGPDGGIDIVAERKDHGANEVLVIQCKHQRDNISRPKVQELWGVVTSNHSYSGGVFVTSSDFTPQARDFAKDKRLKLLNRKHIITLAQEFKIAMCE